MGFGMDALNSDWSASPQPAAKPGCAEGSGGQGEFSR
jgi:hypothetical protein